ncbi:MAG: hypothetical protein NWE83_13950 [Candidatus Bathyarchaeota archaeon]|nr:hypothetical protein [Candidatus Bathyarchaeota archaeon]
MSSTLCKIGLHKWSRKRFSYLSGSNVRDVEQHCQRCGKRKHWVETA